MFAIPQNEYSLRVERLLNLMNKKELDAIYISSGTSFSYFTGYHYIATERPAAMIVKNNGDVYFFGPVMEREHIRTQTKMVKDVFSYFDYPGKIHPMKKFAEWLEQLNLKGRRIGTESLAFYSSPWGYKAIDLRELLPDTSFHLIWEDIYRMRMIKSEVEIKIIRESLTSFHP
jgi:Xaa-Pro dipeptidase